jgi:ATP-binding cassette subfamily B protein
MQQRAPDPARPRLVRRIAAEVRPFRGHLALLFALAVAAAPLGLLAPVPLQVAVDVAIGGLPPPAWLAALWPGIVGVPPAALVAACAGTVVAVAVVVQAVRLVENVLRDLAGERIVHAFRERLFLRLQRLSLARHDREGSAAAVYGLEHDGGALHVLVVYILLPLAQAAATLAATLAATALVAPSVALVAAVLAPCLVGLVALTSEPLRRSWARVHAHELDAFAVPSETLGALRIVRAFGREGAARDRFAARNARTVRVRVRAQALESAVGFAVAMAVAAATAAVLLIGAREVLEGRLTVGGLLLVMAYLAMLVDPIQTMGTHVAQQQRALSRLDRAFAVLDEAEDPPDDPSAPPRGRARGEIAFRDVSFRHRADLPTLEGVSFSAAAGGRIGVVGRTGAGKSTLAALLVRLHDPTSGAVELDGTDLRAWRLEDLRRQFAVVAQDTVLFSDTVEANIAFARPQATRGEVEAAARAAGIHDLIASLPEGYGTLCGERGQRFSGGERQRIALARAILADAPVLVLDEPTSALDTGTEAAILSAIERQMPGRTVVLITHRLAALASCDRVLVLDRGRLVEDTDDVARVAAELAAGAGGGPPRG